MNEAAIINSMSSSEAVRYDPLVGSVVIVSPLLWFALDFSNISN